MHSIRLKEQQSASNKKLTKLQNHKKIRIEQIDMNECVDDVTQMPNLKT